MERIKQALELARAERRHSNKVDNAQRVVAHPSIETEPITEPEIREVQVTWETLRETRIIHPNDNREWMESYRVLRTQVLHRMNEHGYQSIAIASANPGEGKTITAINLSMALATQGNLQIILVDADLRRPSIHHYLEDNPPFGLSNYLMGEVTLAESLINPTDVDNLLILPSGKTRIDSVELLDSVRTTRLIESLKDQYPDSLVVFDVPPILFAGDAIALSRHIDCMLIVVEDGRTRPDELKRVWELLEGKNVIGTVLNKSQRQNMSYY